MKRYTDNSKLVADASSLKLTRETQVILYQGDKWHDEIAVDLEGQAEKFEELKPVILFIAANLCEMDFIAQNYSALHGDSSFAESYEIACVLLHTPDEIRVTYYGVNENTEFDVVFQHTNNALILKSFGMVKDIPLYWDKK